MITSATVEWEALASLRWWILHSSSKSTPLPNYQSLDNRNLRVFSWKFLSTKQLKCLTMIRGIMAAFVRVNFSHTTGLVWFQKQYDISEDIKSGDIHKQLELNWHSNWSDVERWKDIKYTYVVSVLALNFFWVLIVFIFKNKPALSTECCGISWTFIRCNSCTIRSSLSGLSVFRLLAEEQSLGRLRSGPFLWRLSTFRQSRRHCWMAMLPKCTRWPSFECL